MVPYFEKLTVQSLTPFENAKEKNNDGWLVLARSLAFYIGTHRRDLQRILTTLQSSVPVSQNYVLSWRAFIHWRDLARECFSPVQSSGLLHILSDSLMHLAVLYTATSKLMSLDSQREETDLCERFKYKCGFRLAL